MKNCVVPIGSTLKIGQHNVRQGYMLYSDKRLGLDSKAIFRTETTNCRLKVCVKAYCTTKCRNCQSTLHHSRLKVCGKHTTQQKAESLWQRTLQKAEILSKHSTQRQAENSVKAQHCSGAWGWTQEQHRPRPALEQFSSFIVQKRESKLTGERQGASRQRGQGEMAVQVTWAGTARTGQEQAGSTPRKQSGK